MAFIYSTDDQFKKISRFYNEKCFVSFMRKGGVASGIINISNAIVRKTTLPKKVIVGIDKEKNEIIIMQSANGNITVSRTEACAHATLRRLLIYAGYKAEELPVGRFKAEVDKDCYIHVYLDCPL